MIKNNIFLVGLMGSGKTSIGKALAKKLNMNFIDLDREIIEETNSTISKIFDDLGEHKFRELETQTLNKISTVDNTVISTGGGVILKPENIKTMRENGSIIHLDVDVKSQLQRVKNTENRPLLNKGNIKEKLVEIKHQRDGTYKSISLASVNTSNMRRNDIVNRIEMLIK